MGCGAVAVGGAWKKMLRQPAAAQADRKQRGACKQQALCSSTPLPTWNSTLSLLFIFPLTAILVTVQSDTSSPTPYLQQGRESGGHRELHASVKKPGVRAPGRLERLAV